MSTSAVSVGGQFDEPGGLGVAERGEGPSGVDVADGNRVGPQYRQHPRHRALSEGRQLGHRRAAAGDLVGGCYRGQLVATGIIDSNCEQRSSSIPIRRTSRTSWVRSTPEGDWFAR
jgi:hypothetical protein